MVGPDKSQVLDLFTFNVPGYQLLATWVEDRKVEPPKNVGLILANCPPLNVPLPWGQFENSKIQIPVVGNVAAWVSSALWSAGDGSIINTDPPTWSVRTIELSQLAAQLTVDTAVDVGESVYNVYDASVRALAEMMMVAAYRQLFSMAPDPNGPESFHDIATAESTVVDAGNEPLSFRLLMCLRQQLDINEGLAEQYSIVLARDVYADFVELMTGVGLEPRLDAIMGRENWFFDRVRVVESDYVDSGNAMMFKADMTMLDEDRRQMISAGVGRGTLLASTGPPGVIVSNSKEVDTLDQSLTTLQLNVGLVHCGNCVSWLASVAT